MNINNFLLIIPSTFLFFVSLVLLDIDHKNIIAQGLFYAVPFPSVILWMIKKDNTPKQENKN